MVNNISTRTRGGNYLPHSNGSHNLQRGISPSLKVGDDDIKLPLNDQMMNIHDGFLT
jgi:hypothetical protein